MSSSAHDHLTGLSATEAARLIAAGELSSSELVLRCLERIEDIDPWVNAIVTLAIDRATSEAAAADRPRLKGETLGPLHGLPVAIKDLQPTARVRTTYGSSQFADYVPSEDAGIVAKIRGAGG